jgi:DnaK suppressor protein
MPQSPAGSDAPYTTEQLAPVREALLRRRYQLVSSERDQSREMADEQARDPAVEEEEAAAHQLAQFVASRMREGFQRELQLIDGALQRMDAGVYGRCDECDEPIAIERLKALPYTRLCAADATREEREKVLRSQGRSLTF